MPKLTQPKPGVPHLTTAIAPDATHNAASRLQHADLGCVSRAATARSAELLRLGLLMALTMTLHNFPEGFAVSQLSLYKANQLSCSCISSESVMWQKPCAMGICGIRWSPSLECNACNCT